jgi:DNA-binding NarL/FixJ family response regulator
MSTKQSVKVLIVEDEVLTAHAIANHLKNLGYTVIGFANSGEDAIEMAAQARPDVVLMDIKLKGPVDGVSATHRIQSGLNIPVIYLTASSDTETIKRALHSSPYGYIVKPFKETDLLDAIKNAISRRKAKRDVHK